MPNVLATIKNMPEALLIIEEMQAYYRKEKEKRQVFYDWITEDTKAEFINGKFVVHSPDLCYFRKEIAATFTENQTLFPAPDFIVEVLSESTKER